MLKYLLGLLKHLFNKNISIFALVDNVSKLSPNAKINRWCKLYNSSVGDYTYISPKTELTNVDIGKFCSIASNCMIGLSTHSLKYISTSPIFTTISNSTGQKWSSKNCFNENQHINIGNDVWIGSNAIIVGNIPIGDGAVIATGAVVTKDVPSYAIVGGVPARIIRYRFDKIIINKLNEIQWWNFHESKIKDCIDYFQADLVTVDSLNALQNKLKS